MFNEITNINNLFSAYTKAKKGKTLKSYVIEFEKNLNENLTKLQEELNSGTYKPKPLQTFILYDPKTRKISKSNFRDRVIHHAICNVIEPILNKSFIFDSYANRIGKGSLKALERFDNFKRKVSKNNSRSCFVLKSDIKQYFETIDHKILLNVLKKKIDCLKTLTLIQKILDNHSIRREERTKKGMPLGNLTSQFFANLYLNELDQYVKHKLKIKYYIRYVDDFVILYNSTKVLKYYKNKISKFLQSKLNIYLHPDKTKIINMDKSITFLGFRIFYHHRIISKKNLKKFQRKFEYLKTKYESCLLDREKVVELIEGWLAFVSNANTYKYRKKPIQQFNAFFPIKKETKINNPKKYQRFKNKVDYSNLEFSMQKTLLLFNKRRTILDIAKQRNLKIGTVWKHISNLVEYRRIPIYKVISKGKLKIILKNIKDSNESLKQIKSRIKNQDLSYDEIACVLSHLKSKNRKKDIFYLITWYQKTNCQRKCFYNKKLRHECKVKLNLFATKNPTIQWDKKEFLNFFNNNLNICVLPDKEKKSYISFKHFSKNIKIPKSSEKLPQITL